MFTSLPVENKSHITPQKDVGLGFAPVVIVVLLVFVGLGMYKLGQRNKVKELRDKALDQLLAKSGMTLIEASALDSKETVEPVLPPTPAEPVQPVSPAPVMEAVLPPPAPQDEVDQHHDDEPVVHEPVNRSRVFIQDAHDSALHEGIEVPHQSEEEWEEQDRRRELMNQEITPEMVAEFEAMDAERK